MLQGKNCLSRAVTAKRSGNLTFAELLARLRCEKCRRKMPGPVYLCASQHREFQGGAAPDWSLEVVPPPRNLEICTVAQLGMIGGPQGPCRPEQKSLNG